MDSPLSPKSETGLLVDTSQRTIVMNKEKITKNTVRYTAAPVEGAAPAIKTVYIEKWALGSSVPSSITLTLQL